MKIHAGYEISYTCLQPTPMILMLSVHFRALRILSRSSNRRYLQRAISTASATTSALCYCTAEMRRGSLKVNPIYQSGIFNRRFRTVDALTPANVAASPRLRKMMSEAANAS